jgi:hypothetical protein
VSTTSGFVPMLTCPSCDYEWQWDDYYDIKRGDERECPRCEKTAYVTDVDTQIYVCLSSHDNGASK